MPKNAKNVVPSLHTTHNFMLKLPPSGVYSNSFGIILSVWMGKDFQGVTIPYELSTFSLLPDVSRVAWAQMMAAEDPDITPQIVFLEAPQGRPFALDPNLETRPEPPNVVENNLAWPAAKQPR